MITFLLYALISSEIIVSLLSYLKTKFCVAQVGLELSMYLRMAIHS